jgi:hypothetical protein
MKCFDHQRQQTLLMAGFKNLAKNMWSSPDVNLATTIKWAVASYPRHQQRRQTLLMAGFFSESKTCDHYQTLT